MKTTTLHLVFHIESSDRSVGIMSEGFSAWTTDGEEYCDLSQYEENFTECKFKWYSNSSGDEVPRPMYASVVEHALHGYTVGMYAGEIESYNTITLLENNPDNVSEDRPLTENKS